MTRPPAIRRLGTWAGWGCVVVLCVLHGAAIWTGMGGRAGITGEWPPWRDDHPLYYHSALVTRHFLKQTGTTAGYDPAFMSGYAKSVVFPASSTLPELVVAAFGGSRPERAYKVYVLVAAALIPWLVAGAAIAWRVGAGGTAVAVLLFLVYVWTDFPINYATFGMIPYLLMVPIGLMATGVFGRYLGHGGFGWWLVSAILMVAVVFVHLTGAMIVAPAAGLAYATAVVDGSRTRRKLSASRHAGVWTIPVLVLMVNAFWWLPGIWLAATKGPSGFAFNNSDEPVLARLWQIARSEAPIESVLIASGGLGLAVLARIDRISAAGSLGFVASGFGWGYLAAASPSLGFLQTGRHTYAFYTGLALASAIGLPEVMARLRHGAGGRLDRWAAIGMILVGTRFFGPAVFESVRTRMGGPGREPFLSSRPSARLLWVVDRVKRYVRPGERLLYEEGGFGLPGVPDPYQGGRFSGLLPERTGVEMIGGPYLHASLTTNFTQFGEGSLFGEAEWGRAHFVRYARLYRPSAIVCWSPRARAFCRSNPDLIDVRDDDGMVMIGRVKGFEGDAIEGTATVEATPGRLRVRGVIAGVDGTVVLRYHSVPCLRIDPPARWEPVSMERDPVPFIRLLPPFDDTALELRFPPDRSDPGADRPEATRGPGHRVAPSPGKE